MCSVQVCVGGGGRVGVRGVGVGGGGAVCAVFFVWGARQRVWCVCRGSRCSRVSTTRPHVAGT